MKGQFEHQKQVTKIYGNISTVLRIAVDPVSAKHFLETIVTTLANQGKAWKTAHVICRGMSLKNLIKAIELPYSHTPSAASVNVKVLKKEDFFDFSKLLNALKVGTEEFEAPDVDSLDDWRKKNFDYVKSKTKEREVVILLLDPNDQSTSIPLLEKLASCCSNYDLKIDRVCSVYLNNSVNHLYLTGNSTRLFFRLGKTLDYPSSG